MARLLAPAFRVDTGKTLMMCLIHDPEELYTSDISAAALPDETGKHIAEERDVRHVLSRLPAGQKEELFILWREYHDNTSPEARPVKAIDKAETIIRHNHGENPPDFDYQFNPDYGNPTSPAIPFYASCAKYPIRKPPVRKEKSAPENN